MIRILSFPYFLATKLEAFRGRGEGDYYLSKDIEDIVTVLAGRGGFLGELERVKDSPVGEYLVSEFSAHLANVDFRQAIRGFIPQRSSNRNLATQIEADLAEFCGRL